MFYIGGNKYEVKKFPDNTMAPAFLCVGSEVNITWLYDSDEELSHLMMITRHCQKNGMNVSLTMPYVPNARMDRVHSAWGEIFTLKYFCDFINFLNFKTVTVLDVHSNVTLALINNICALDSNKYIDEALDDIIRKYSNSDILTMFYPDEGAGKRYSDLIKAPYTIGMKHRDWQTGNITGYEVINPELVKDKDVFIVDDISSKGGTFYHAAKALKAVGANKIFLFVTHCENTIFEGELLKDNGLIEHIYTTDSILRKEHEKITRLELAK